MAPATAPNSDRTRAGDTSAEVAAKVADAIRFKDKMVAAAYKAGVKIAFGTDVGPGVDLREFGLMHNDGMSNMDIIVLATRSAADSSACPTRSELCRRAATATWSPPRATR